MLTFIQCSNCGKVCQKAKKEIDRKHRAGKFKHFCSMLCYRHYTRANYSTTSQACHYRARYNFLYKLCRPLVCAKCNRYSPKNQVHHKDGDYKNNEPSNLECLCSDCHPQSDKIMRIKREHRIMRLLIRQGVVNVTF